MSSYLASLPALDVAEFLIEICTLYSQYYHACCPIYNNISPQANQNEASEPGTEVTYVSFLYVAGTYVGEYLVEIMTRGEGGLERGKSKA